MYSTYSYIYIEYIFRKDKFPKNKKLISLYLCIKCIYAYLSVCVQTWFFFCSHFMYINTNNSMCVLFYQVYDVDRWFSLIKKKKIVLSFYPNFIYYNNMKNLWVCENPIHIYNIPSIASIRENFLLFICICIYFSHVHTYYYYHQYEKFSAAKENIHILYTQT